MITVITVLAGVGCVCYIAELLGKTSWGVKLAVGCLLLIEILRTLPVGR
jgi:hypothetical protein